MAGKSFSLVLHSHIPYVLAHGSWPHGMDWLYEAAAETYLPLIDVFERLAAEGLPARTSIS
jgi:1,4-alpha-glucan branching enzyme